jgi:hypothetical protein
MRKYVSLRKVRLLMLLLGMVSGNARFAVGQDQINSSSERLSLISQFLASCYPDLPVARSTIAITMYSPMGRIVVNGDVGFEVTSKVVLNDEPGPSRDEKRVMPVTGLKGRITFEGDTRTVEGAVIQGYFTEEGSNTKLHAVVEAHPEWDQEKIQEELRSAGAVYGPWNKQGFIDAIPIKALESLLGAPLTVDSTSFRFDSGPHEGNFAILAWQVRLTYSDKDGTKRHYLAKFDPFKGRLLFLAHDIFAHDN